MGLWNQGLYGTLKSPYFRDQMFFTYHSLQTKQTMYTIGKFGAPLATKDLK